MPTIPSNFQRFFPWICLTLITLGGLALRLYRLTDLGLWYDEAFSVLIARRPWGAMNQAIFSDVHPPVYYYLLHFWGANSIAWARGFSVFCGTLAIPLLFVCTQRLLGKTGALLACVILAIHPLHVYYSQEVRMYAFLIVLIVGILSTALRMVSDAPTVKIWHWVTLGLFAWGIMATQYLGAAVAGGVWLGLFAARLYGGSVSCSKKWLAAWFISGVVVLLGIVPFLLWGTRWGMVTNFEAEYPLHLLVIRDLIDGLEGHIHSAPWTFFGIYQGEFFWDLAWVFPLLALHFIGAFFLSRKGHRAESIFLLTFLGGCLFFLALYQAAGFRFYTRYYVLLVPASAILIGSAFTQGLRIVRIVCFMLVVILFLSNSITCVRVENRETTMQMAKRIRFAAKQQPVLIDNIGLALSLKAIIPESDIRHAPQGEYQPVERNLLGESGIAKTWPEAWRGRNVWIVLGGWGNLPRTEAELQQQIMEFTQRMGAPKGSLRFCGVETIHKGFKWSALFEWTPQ